MQYRTLEPINTALGGVEPGSLIELSSDEAFGLLQSRSIEATFKRFTVKKIAPGTTRKPLKSTEQSNVQPFEMLEIGD